MFFLLVHTRPVVFLQLRRQHSSAFRDNQCFISDRLIDGVSPFSLVFSEASWFCWTPDGSGWVWFWAWAWAWAWVFAHMQCLILRQPFPRGNHYTQKIYLNQYVQIIWKPKCIICSTIHWHKSSKAGIHLKHVGHGVKYGQESMLLVEAFALAWGAQVIIGANGALETCSSHRPFAPVTGHPWVQHWRVMRRMAHVRSSWGTHRIRSRGDKVRRGEWEPRDPMRWGIMFVLLSFWKGKK